MKKSKRSLGFVMDKKLYKRLKSTTDELGLSMAEVVRRGVINELRELEVDNHE